MSFLFDWLNKPMYMLTVADRIIIIIGSISILYVIKIIVSFMEKLIKKIKKKWEE